MTIVRHRMSTDLSEWVKCSKSANSIIENQGELKESEGNKCKIQVTVVMGIYRTLNLSCNIIYIGIMYIHKYKI